MDKDSYVFQGRTAKSRSDTAYGKIFVLETTPAMVAAWFRETK